MAPPYQIAWRPGVVLVQGEMIDRNHYRKLVGAGSDEFLGRLNPLLVRGV